MSNIYDIQFLDLSINFSLSASLIPPLSTTAGGAAGCADSGGSCGPPQSMPGCGR